MKITVTPYPLFLALLYFRGRKQQTPIPSPCGAVAVARRWRRRSLPGSPSGVAPRGDAQRSAAVRLRSLPGLTAPGVRESLGSPGVSPAEMSGILQGTVSSRGWIWPSALGGAWPCAAAQQRALACTAVAQRRGFISGYLGFGCSRNETARAGRLACIAHKSRIQADLSARVTLPGKGLRALLVVVLHVRAWAMAGLEAALELPAGWQWRVRAEVKYEGYFQKEVLEGWKRRTATGFTWKKWRSIICN